MKAYDKWPVYEYDHPEDMEVILEYLRSHGDLHVYGKTVEKLYSEFSIDYYYGSRGDWAVPTEDALESFARYMDDYEF